jgi:integrase
MENHWIENWLNLQENPRTIASYRIGMEKFAQFCKDKHFNGLDTVVLEYRAARDDGDRRKLQQFIDAWADVLQEYTIWLKQHHAPATVKNQLAILQSFFKTAMEDLQPSPQSRTYFYSSLSILMFKFNHLYYSSPTSNFDDSTFEFRRHVLFVTSKIPKELFC